MRLHIAVLLLILLAGCVGERSEAVNLEVGLEFTRFPVKYTCDGEDISPKIRVGGLESRVKSLAVVVVDPDAPGGTFTHWVAWNLKPLREIPENVPKEPVVKAPIKAVQGKNDFGRIGYNGPCPPKGRPHRYVFKVYALDTELSLPPGASRSELERAIKGHVLQYGEAVATYGR